ncbi:UvrD-helicase domain-containing protein, partial [Vibrio parahaemolyticus]|uniref:UvrD-helicase domain-containing protein n=1 Tax=Vibrio parahaemolyticus TaxID=670 RepID=UPI001173B569
TIVDTEVFNRKLISSFRGVNKYNSKLHGLLFNIAYRDTLTIKDIEKFCFSDEPKVKGHKTPHQKAKALHEKLRTSGFIKNNNELAYKKCKSFTESELPTLYGKEATLKLVIEKKHKLLMDNLDSRKEELIQKLWINLVDEKLYNYEDGKSIARKGTPSYTEFNELKETLYRSGIVSFRDAFELARVYVKSNKSIREIMSTRFNYLFADEMQDTQQHQMELISSVFNDSVVKQYFGDPDQAIFDGVSSGDIAWNYNQADTKKLKISDSKRYSTEISQCLNTFKRELDNVTGNATWKSYKPCILIYDEPEKALEMFHNEIEKHELTKQDIYLNWKRESAPFNAVGFVGKDTVTKK